MRKAFLVSMAVASSALLVTPLNATAVFDYAGAETFASITAFNWRYNDMKDDMLSFGTGTAQPLPVEHVLSLDSKISNLDASILSRHSSMFIDDRGSFTLDRTISVDFAPIADPDAEDPIDYEGVQMEIFGLDHFASHLVTENGFLRLSWSFEGTGDGNLSLEVLSLGSAIWGQNYGLDGSVFSGVTDIPVVAGQFVEITLGGGSSLLAAAGSTHTHMLTGGLDYRFHNGVIPEPATWALLVSGFGIVGIAARRRRMLPMRQAGSM